MSNRTVGHNRNPGESGAGWTGVTDDDKRNAGGKAPDGANADRRAHFAAANANDVADTWGTGHWTNQNGVWVP
jgi:hypothetical protein